MRNFVPSDIDENGAKGLAKWDIRWKIGCIAVGILIVSFIGFLYFSVFLKHLGLRDGYIVSIVVVLTIATTIICTVGVWRLFGNGWYLKAMSGYKKGATCPSCQKSYCIEHTKTQTISESVITETSSNSKGETTTKHYRVGVRRIHWRCKECGETGEGEEDYKERI